MLGEVARAQIAQICEALLALRISRPVTMVLATPDTCRAPQHKLP